MKKLLIVVDYQNDFVNGSLGFEKALHIEKHIYDKIQVYKKDDGDIIFTLDTHYDDYLNTVEGKHLPIPHCLKGSRGHELYGKIKDCLADGIVFEKNTYPSLELGNYLKDKNYEIVEICGLVSNICVLSNAIIVKAALPNAKIVIDTKAIASYNPDLHEKALAIMKGLHFEVTN